MIKEKIAPLISTKVKSWKTMACYLYLTCGIVNCKYQGSKKHIKNFSFIMQAIFHYRIVNEMVGFIFVNNLEYILALNPKIIKKPLGPYLCSSWSKQDKNKLIINHFNFISKVFENKLQLFYVDNGYCLLKIEYDDNCNVSLFVDNGQRREGELGLTLRNELHQVIYTITITISHENGGSMYIGAIQGPKNIVKNKNEIIRKITKKCYGLRPKSLILEFSRMLAKNLGINTIYAISNKGHVLQSYRSLRYIVRKKGHVNHSKITFNYNKHWKESGGYKSSDYFYKIPIQTVKKNIDELKSQKRKLYTKRYQWLSSTEELFNEKLNKIKAVNITNT